MLFFLRYIDKNSTLGSILLKQHDGIGISQVNEERENCNIHNMRSDKEIQIIPNMNRGLTLLCRALPLLPMCTYFGNLPILENYHINYDPKF